MQSSNDFEKKQNTKTQRIPAWGVFLHVERISLCDWLRLV